MDDLWRDVRFPMRTLLRTPAFTLVAVATLALGIGANTAIFSVVNALLLRPLPYPEADRLVFLAEWSEQVPNMSFSVANLKDVRDQSTVFESIVGSNGQDFTLAAVSGAGATGEPERVSGRQVTSGVFTTLGKQPIVGRGFGPDEEKPGAPGVVLLGEGFWERRFGRDPGVVGRVLELSGDHHRYSDQHGDVHSPGLQGFLWSHVGWIMADNWHATDYARIPDLAKYPSCAG